MDNSGGRVTYTLESQVRIVGVTGVISDDIYVVVSTKSDRKGYVTVHKLGEPTEGPLQVHFRRIVSCDLLGQACVCEVTAGKYQTVCPSCLKVLEVVDYSSDSIVCDGCDNRQLLYWIGVKPMTNDNPTETLSVKAKPEKTQFDVAAVLAKPQVELWSKGVPFDHQAVSVVSYVLLFTGDTPRKMCFNTYNGGLGKKTELPLDEFLTNNKEVGKKMLPWYDIKNLDTTRKKLSDVGYDKIDLQGSTDVSTVTQEE